LVAPALAQRQPDYEAVRRDIEAILDDADWDDGSWGPVLVRLAWHASGTYDLCTRDGGSNGASMRFAPESTHGANNGLAHARQRLEQVKAKHPDISYADLWTLAGTVAIEAMGGPKLRWRPGRTDVPDGSKCPADGRLPDASQGNVHTRSIFQRMGFTDRETVALIGAHALGRCHTDRSGYSGPWTNAPTTFSNDFFVQLLEQEWKEKKWNGPRQYEDKSGQLMMLPTDLALLADPVFRQWVEAYAKDEALFFRDFASAWQQLLELGVPYRGGVLASVF
jgi:cytochrome c peroxidase